MGAFLLENMKTGRKTSLTQALADKITAQIVEGKSLKTICAQDDMPNIGTVFRWLSEGAKEDASPLLKDFCDKYAHAREAQQDVLVEEMLDIARKTNARNANANRLLIDVLKWRVGKLSPRKYGEKSTVEVAGVKERPLVISFIKAKGEKDE